MQFFEEKNSNRSKQKQLIYLNILTSGPALSFGKRNGQKVKNCKANFINLLIPKS